MDNDAIEKVRQELEEAVHRRLSDVILTAKSGTVEVSTSPRTDGKIDVAIKQDGCEKTYRYVATVKTLGPKPSQKKTMLTLSKRRVWEFLYSGSYTDKLGYSEYCDRVERMSVKPLTLEEYDDLLQCSFVEILVAREGADDNDGIRGRGLVHFASTILTAMESGYKIVTWIGYTGVLVAGYKPDQITIVD